ncbi:MAG: hypothetical protein KJ714_00525 [Euryarchaeota archaeon]|nr:hypothetical protein [Euryarchaeota archaeon]
MRELNMNANELVKECEKMLNVGWNPIKYIRLARYSFRGDFNYFKKIILDNVEETEKKKFIDICDNRIERAKAFLQDVGTVIGFFIISLSIVLAVSTMTRGGTPVDLS